MTNLFKIKKETIIRLAFLIPIFAVSAVSISHVVSWYDLTNPISWAIYLSIAVEIAAMSAIAAASVKVKGFSVWFVFIIVTLIQFIGNIFFAYSEINTSSENFKNWTELSSPIFESMGSDMSDIPAQKRWLAILEGGLLPLISLTCLHFFIKYGENEFTASTVEPINEIIDAPLSSIIETSDSTELFENTEDLPMENLIDNSVEQPAPSNIETITSNVVYPKPSQPSQKIKKIQRL
jgi:hypothetical protein